MIWDQAFDDHTQIINPAESCYQLNSPILRTTSSAHKWQMISSHAETVLNNIITEPEMYQYPFKGNHFLKVEEKNPDQFKHSCL